MVTFIVPFLVRLMPVLFVSNTENVIVLSPAVLTFKKSVGAEKVILSGPPKSFPPTGPEKWSTNI